MGAITLEFMRLNTANLSKTISLEDETYDRLDRTKGDDESFSDVIDRLLGTGEPHPLYDIAGRLEESTVAQLRARSTAFREQVHRRMERES